MAILFKLRSLSLPVIFILVLGIFNAGCTEKSTQEYFFESDRNKRATGQNGMVSSAHPLASEAGLQMLQKGGNAIDAAVATAFALNVVEPNMSGIGGGGSMLIWKPEEQVADYVDFYSAKRVETYQEIDHENLEEDFNLLSTGVPGTVAGLLSALDKHGNLSRQEVMAPAIRYARDGFPVYLTLGQFIADNKEKLTRYEDTKQLFWPDGEPLSVGELLRQPTLAETLQRISDQGKSAFYTGSTAENMVEVLNDGKNPVTLEDFHTYEPQWQKIPLCGSYKNYTVLSAPMPQTGVFIIQALNILENYDLKSLGIPTLSSDAFDILASTLRLSIADRIEYVSDPNWENIPVNGLISREYATMRRSLVGTGNAIDTVKPGDAAAYQSVQLTDTCQNLSVAESDVSPANDWIGEFQAYLSDDPLKKGHSEKTDTASDSGETTHVSVIDKDGNAVSLSTTLSPVFGSGAWVDGFILNTSGYNFTHMEEDEDWSGKHPYRVRASTIAPTIILNDGQAELVIGAPGGGRIPTAILQNIIYILEYDLDPLDAVKMPRIFPSRDGTDIQLEVGFRPEVLQQARDMGYNIQPLSTGYARLYLVYRKKNLLIGVSDPRHDGEPRGY